MDKRKVESLVKCIDDALVELAKATDGNHISAFICNNSVLVFDHTEGKQKFNYYRSVEDEQGDFEW